MPDSVAGNRCSNIRNNVDRLACELCVPNADGQYMLQSSGGDVPSPDQATCYELVRTLSDLGFTFTAPVRMKTGPDNVSTTQHPSGHQKPDKAAEQPSISTPKEISTDSEAKTSEADIPDASAASDNVPAQEKPYWTGSLRQGESRAKVVRRSFTAQIVPDGTKKRAKRRLLLGKGKGIEIVVEYSAKASEKPGVYTLKYSIMKNGSLFGKEGEVDFKVMNGRANLGFEISSPSPEMSRIDSIRIVDLAGAAQRSGSPL